MVKGWKISRVYPFPNIKMAWDGDDGEHIYIVKNKSSNIPYRILLNNSEIDSTGTFLQAKKIAVNYMRQHPDG